MLILGIDPGLATTGYGIIDDRGFKLVEAGVIRTLAQTPIQDRVKKIFDEISCIIRERRPEILVLEKIYSHYKHPTTAILMGHARAMACLVCGAFNIKLISYPSTRIKKAVTGNGHASKYQVQRMVQNLLQLKSAPEPVDVSDALAMAISYCFIHSRPQHRAIHGADKTRPLSIAPRKTRAFRPGMTTGLIEKRRFSPPPKH